MIQQINLYLPEFRLRRDWLRLERMLGVAGTFALMLVLLGGFEYWSLVRLENARAEQEAAVAEAQASAAALMSSMDIKQEDQALAQQVLNLEATLEEKQSMLRFLAGQTLGNAAGFSEYLADLARYHIAGLSLTGIELNRGGEDVQLSGQVFRAESVPVYLQNLSKGRSYLGKSFSTVRIEEGQFTEEREILDFTVSTTGENDAAP